jgi:hypothetical protein
LLGFAHIIFSAKVPLFLVFVLLWLAVMASYFQFTAECLSEYIAFFISVDTNSFSLALHKIK